MNVPDAINGGMELFGGFFITMSILRLYKDKEVHGISWMHAGYFTVWGWWNLYYYPHLNQWLSFIGSILIAITNTIWVGQMLYYRKASNGKIH
jgi:hypothetical protein